MPPESTWVLTIDSASSNKSFASFNVLLSILDEIALPAAVNVPPATPPIVVYKAALAGSISPFFAKSSTAL